VGIHQISQVLFDANDIRATDSDRLGRDGETKEVDRCCAFELRDECSSRRRAIPLPRIKNAYSGRLLEIDFDAHVSACILQYLDSPTELGVIRRPDQCVIRISSEIYRHLLKATV